VGVLVEVAVFVEVPVKVGVLVGGIVPVGVLVEVPVMLSVCAACNRTRHWFAFEPARSQG